MGTIELFLIVWTDKDARAIARKTFLDLKRLKTSLLAPISTAKIYVSELTVHHPPTTSYSKSNQPPCVMDIPGGSRGGGYDFHSG